MSTYPPPPYGYDPRQQRQFLRDQARARKDMQRSILMQAKYQRDLRRQQDRAHRRSSILGPLLVIAVGIIVLLIGLGRLPLTRFAAWYSRWWPLFLVSAGVILLVEWFVDQHLTTNPGPDGQPIPIRRGIGGGAVFLLILLAIAGPILYGVRDSTNLLAHGFSINPDNIDEIFGERHDSTEQIDQPLAPGVSLSIDNPHGDITIVGKSNDNHIHIAVAKQFYVHSDSDITDREQHLSPRLQLFGSTLNVAVPWVRGATSDVTITLPESSPTTVTAGHGTINISDLRAPVTITSNHGDIELNRITGPVDAHINSSGSSFAAHTITGPVALKGHAQDLNLSDITGDTSLEGDFFGETHLERLHGPVIFRTSRTQLSLLRLDGAVDLSNHSELTGSQLIGPIRLHTSNRNISLERVLGDVDLTNSKGSVDISAAAPLGNITVENRDGAVTLTVPDHAGLTLDAQTHGAAIETDLPLPSPTTDKNNTFLSGRIPFGEAHITLHTTHADIDIHKGNTLPPTPTAPPAPSPTPNPASNPPALPKAKAPRPKAPATPPTTP